MYVNNNKEVNIQTAENLRIDKKLKKKAWFNKECQDIEDKHRTSQIMIQNQPSKYKQVH